jgi:hypothetical protein
MYSKELVRGKDSDITKSKGLVILIYYLNRLP